jgi:hypothetical protein
MLQEVDGVGLFAAAKDGASALFTWQPRPPKIRKTGTVKTLEPGREEPRVDVPLTPRPPFQVASRQ